MEIGKIHWIDGNGEGAEGVIKSETGESIFFYVDGYNIPTGLRAGQVVGIEVIRDTTFTQVHKVVTT